MTQLTEWIWKACAALGLRAELNFRLLLSNGQEITTVARIADVGAPNGMLLFRSYDEVCNFTQALSKEGYGYSVIDEPRPGEEFDLESYEEMFRDWGWSGQLGIKPDWMR
jgi:hypothetical protein